MTFRGASNLTHPRNSAPANCRIFPRKVLQETGVALPHHSSSVAQHSHSQPRWRGGCKDRSTAAPPHLQPPSTPLPSTEPSRRSQPWVFSFKWVHLGFSGHSCPSPGGQPPSPAHLQRGFTLAGTNVLLGAAGWCPPLLRKQKGFWFMIKEKVFFL